MKIAALLPKHAVTVEFVCCSCLPEAAELPVPPQRFPSLFLGRYGQLDVVWSRHWHLVHQFSALIAWPVKH